MDIRPKTIFCDIDGVLVSHQNAGVHAQMGDDVKILPGVIETLYDWDLKGYQIILTTGRRESLRTRTEEQLLGLGIYYDKLIMGVTGGERVVINDRKPNSRDDMAWSINVDRNEGLEGVNI